MKHLLSIKNLRVSRSLSFGLHIGALQLGRNTILCVVGPNGSGKTTLIECLTGLLTPPIGAILIDGTPVSQNLRATKKTLGFVPDDENWFVKELCAKEYFALLAGIYRQAGVGTDMRARVEYLAGHLHFTAFEQPLHQLSHGNKKKVQIIAGLMHEPKLIILDELRNGLDPLAIINAENLLRQEASRGAGIIATTHDLWWAERIASEVMLLLDGNVAVHQKTSRILKRHGSLEALFMQTVNTAD